MGLIDGINRFIGNLLDVLRQVGRGRIWLFLFGYFALGWIVLYAHYDFTAPWFHGLISAWTNLIDSQRAAGFTHYQGHFILMPFFFDSAKLILGVLFEGIFLGSVAALFYERFVQVDQDDRFRFGGMIRLWVHFIVALAVINAVVYAANFAAATLLRPIIEYSPRRQFAVTWLIMPFIYICIVGLFFYLVPAIAVYRENILQALRRTVRVFRRNALTSIAMAAFVLAGPIFLANLVASPNAIVERFNPELVYYLLLAGLVVEMVVGFLWMGMAVRLMVDQED